MNGDLNRAKRCLPNSPWYFGQQQAVENRLEVENHGFLPFLSFGPSENNSQASTTNPMATPPMANHVPSFSIDALFLSVLKLIDEQLVHPLDFTFEIGGRQPR